MDGLPAPALHLGRCGARVFVPAQIVQEDPSIRRSHPGKLRQVVGERNEIRDARNRCGPDTQYGSLAHEIQTRARTMMLAASHMASAMTSISIVVRPLPRAETKVSTFPTSTVAKRRGYGAARRELIDQRSRCRAWSRPFEPTLPWCDKAARPGPREEHPQGSHS